VATGFKIEKGIPAPKSRAAYPFADMEVGDSFFIPGMKTSAEISSAISYRRLRHGEKYRSQAVDGGLRVWRVA
jgi:hypothetical protein